MCEISFNEESGTKPAIPPCNNLKDGFFKLRYTFEHFYPSFNICNRFDRFEKLLWWWWPRYILIYISFIFDVGDPGLAFIWRWSVKAAKCAWSFVARQTGALRKTEVGGVDGDGGPLVMLVVVVMTMEICRCWWFRWFWVGGPPPAKLCDQIKNQREIFLDSPQPEVLSSCGEAQTPIHKRDSKKIFKIHKLLTFFPYKGVRVSHTVRWSCFDEETILNIGDTNYGGNYLII